ncbi:MAG: S-methyl-5-thioribose-1-phosphate isomerase [Phototrophicales bacterium]|nr:MAG: S-methyl-5-thioribose-1-phosphate isomerase [Phototrophicales bacterium]RMG75180.1 MAG: S-methyl-5-thioribose-1-phosphate isomerase [Chloroflexota bacterium]
MRTVEWHNNGVRMIDQKRIPWELTHVDLSTYQQVAAAITDMTVRGAPAIGAAAAFGMALAAQNSTAQNLAALITDLEQAAHTLKAARPTAVNLAWAVDHMMKLAHNTPHTTVDDLRQALLKEAQRIADEDVAINRRMGEHGANLIKEGFTVLHHCNTGALATVDHGTALGVIRSAFEQGRKFHVLLDETRPRLQGSRLSAWELEQLGIPYHIIPDTAAGYFMQKGEVDLVLVGADRIVANGDFANKIGTYQIAVLAKENDIPFYTVAPTSTIDLTIATGKHIPIEERDPSEVLAPYGNALVPGHFKARNPAFDVTPHRYLTGIVTENGIAYPPFDESLRAIVK